MCQGPGHLFSSLDNLPKIPPNKELLSKADSVFGIIVSVLFATLFLVCPQILCIVDTSTKEIIPIFNIEYIHSTWYIVLLFSAMGIAGEIIKLVEGRYTRRVLLTTGIEDAISAVLVIFWMMNDFIINPAFLVSMNDIFKGDAWLNNMVARFNLVFMGMILFSLALDFAVTAIKTQKA